MKIPNVEVLTIPITKEVTYTTFVRPHARQLLNELGPLCELLLWTAGTKDYAQTIMNSLDDNTHMQHSIYRDDRWFSWEGYSKPLARLGRDMSKTIIVDNSPHVCDDQHNAIVIEDFHGDPNDKLLVILEDILKGLIKSESTVPQYIQQCEQLRHMARPGQQGLYWLHSQPANSKL
eukprot:TRINITY_DN64007_c0_g1_i1.p1 TRINITY_DN64007_c0_g1~~TRINITY_DN64007_c0_g1_i1.p1  ORF type:complete len:176 (+),score=9.19 TRINITY_DN64007_c0_g1_i1:197-724(+)